MGRLLGAGEVTGMLPAVPGRRAASMRLGDSHPQWEDALEALLPGIGALTALLIMLVLLAV
jgi:hypothetical protein